MSKRNQVRCLGCGKIDEIEAVYLQNLTPPPRIITGQVLTSAWEAEMQQGPLDDPGADHGAVPAMRKCDDCGRTQWVDATENPTATKPAHSHKCINCGEVVELESVEGVGCSTCSGQAWAKSPHLRG